MIKIIYFLPHISKRKNNRSLYLRGKPGLEGRKNQFFESSYSIGNIFRNMSPKFQSQIPNRFADMASERPCDQETNNFWKKL